MNRFKPRRKLVKCKKCHATQNARQAMETMKIAEGIETVGFFCPHCQSWNHLYYETPLISSTRVEVATAGLGSSYRQLQILRTNFTNVFTAEQQRVIQHFQKHPELLILPEREPA